MSSLVKYTKYTAADAAEDQKTLESKSGTNYLKVSEGRTIVRYLPALEGKAFQVYHQHFVERPDGTRTSFPCAARDAGEPCPACAHAERLQRSSKPTDKELAKRFFPRKRIVANCIDRGEPEAGPKLHDMPRTIYASLMAILDSPDGDGDFLDPENGFDICIERKGKGQMDTEYKVIAARNNTPLADSVDQMNEWLTGQTDLEVYTTPLSEAETRARITGGQVEPETKSLPESSEADFGDDFVDVGDNADDDEIPF